ncbi:MAG: acetyl-CoA synthase subunit gamma [Candidatus Riflebacteria bacterium]|nr:acetyl-CoA synthase subunit gamma [Candidatus Riflebacteria bacterium]
MSADERCTSATVPDRRDEPWLDGMRTTAAGEVPRVKTRLGALDLLGAFEARWAIGRMEYRVPPGLYAVGEPTAESTVLVTANYKLSFDRLRRVLGGRNAWLLVLDTKGVNVWCAAGKGTFGTDEIVRQVGATGLERIVSHRQLVVPQLGAPGVSAHEVHRRCGFRVVYGPVRAEDLPAFLDAGLRASPEMRRVRFGLLDRAVLVPVELVMGARHMALIAASALLLGGLGLDGYSLANVRAHGLTAAAMVVASFLAGTVLGPLLLPWLPGRAFAVKGAVLGLVLVGAFALGPWPGPVQTGAWLHLAAWTLLVPAAVSFVVLNFTGATTFTSLSGVLLEIRYAVPLQKAAAVLGLGLWVTGLFVR